MIRPRVLLAVLALAGLLGCASVPAASTPATPAPSPQTAAATLSQNVDGVTAKKLVHDGARLVDVRSPEEYATKHIDGAENVPVDSVGDRDLGPKDTPLVLYCGTGKRAARAAAVLRAKGYTRVYELGGMSRWDD
jgi:rhodanese-related sulfurtransferase